MDTLKSSLVALGRVVGLVFGRNLTRPADHVQERYPHFQFYF